MTFDFFNPSHLAFGSKLTKAFNQLNRLCNEAEDNLVDLFRIYDTYKQYVNRNYVAPFPTRPDAPVRVNELFDLINDGDILKNIGFTDEGKFHCAINIFNARTNRLTVAEGETGIKEGYAFAKASVSNQNPYREIQFVEDFFEGEGTLLFSFRIDEDNNINISEGAYNYFLPSNFNHITGMKNDTENIRPGYKAENYEAIILSGYARWGNHGENTDGSPLSGKSCLKVSINGSLKVYNTGWQCKQYTVVYLKPGDKIDGSWARGIKVKYTKATVPVPTPVTKPIFTVAYTTNVELIEGSWNDYFYNGGTIRLKHVQESGDTTDMQFGITCDDWNKVSTLSLGTIGGSYDTSRTSINARGINPGGQGQTWNSRVCPTWDVQNSINNYFTPENPLYTIGFSSNMLNPQTGRELTLTGFTYTEVNR